MTHPASRGDFSADPRLLRLAALAVVIGAVGAVVAALLIQLIRLFTNLFFFGSFSFAEHAIATHRLQAGLILVGIKALIWIVALASGTSGGVLAPLLIFGAGLGAVEAHFIPIGDPSIWALVSMAAILGGMMRSPFMACLFALELTRDVGAIPAVFVGVITAYAFTVLTMKRSILTEKVARRGYDLFREYAVDPLERVRVGEAMTTEVETVGVDAGPEELDALFSRLKRRGYPVIDEAERHFGMITSADLLGSEGEPRPEATAASLATRPVIVVTPVESCRKAADRMANHGIGRLPVVDPADPTKVLGIVTRSDLLKARARAHEEETRTERFLIQGLVARLDPLRRGGG